MSVVALPTAKSVQGSISASGGTLTIGNARAKSVGIQIANQTVSQPSAPTVANATTGGYIAAGTYQVKVTLVNRWGESQVSSASSTTTTGSTSTITVTAPAADNNATGWNIYMTQAGGSTFYLQNATPLSLWQQPTYTFLNPPTTTGANPPSTPAWVGTIAFMASLDGENWVDLSLTPSSGGAPASAATGNGIWTGTFSGFVFFQAIASAWTSGMAVVTASLQE